MWLYKIEGYSMKLKGTLAVETENRDRLNYCNTVAQ